MSSDSDFRFTNLPVINKRVMRLGMAGNYGLSSDELRYAAEVGFNYWVWGASFRKVTPVLKELCAKEREKHVISYLAMAYTGGMVRRGVEKVLRKLNTDYLDCYQLGWVGRTSRYSPGIIDMLETLKEEGKIRSSGISIHDRQRAGELCKDSKVDLFMIRYNAKHPGAERDIFPHLDRRNPAVVAYTALSWRQLIKPLKGITMPPWPGDGSGASLPPLTPVLCYRFCLSSPHVHVTLTGPQNKAQLDDNLRALEQGPLSANEMQWVRSYGEQVKAKKKMPFI